MSLKYWNSTNEQFINCSLTGWKIYEFQNLITRSDRMILFSSWFSKLYCQLLAKLKGQKRSSWRFFFRILHLDGSNMRYRLINAHYLPYADRFGNSRSTASGASSGYSPSSTSIATSNSQGSNPFGIGGFNGRKRRQIFGGYPAFGGGFNGMSTGHGLGSGSAISAANAAMGQSMSNGNTFTGNEFEEKLPIKIFNAALFQIKNKSYRKIHYSNSHLLIVFLIEVVSFETKSEWKC